MKKILFSISALGLLGLMGAGLNLNAQHAEETRADDPVLSNIFISGDMNSWIHDGKTIDQIDDAYRFQYDGYRGEYHYYSLDISITQGQGFKLVDWDNNHNVDWMPYWNTENIQGFTGGNSGELGSSSNIYCRLTGNYHLVYRFKNSSDKQLYTATLNDSKTIYFVDGEANWINSGEMHLHAWKGTGDNEVRYTDWSQGCPLNALNVKFGETNYKLYSAKVPADTEKVIFKAYKGQTDYKTGDLVASDLAGYYAGNIADYGAAGPIVGRVMDELDFATYNDNLYARSICAVSASTASAVVTGYNGAVGGIKDVLEAVTVNTYDVVNGGTTNVNFSDIVDVLNRRTNPSNIVASFFPETDNSIVTWALALGIVSITSLGGLFLLRKKRAE